MIHIHNKILLSHKMNKMSFAPVCVDLVIVILSEVSQTRERKISYITYMQNQKKTTNELIYKTEFELQI